MKLYRGDTTRRVPGQDKNTYGTASLADSLKSVIDLEEVTVGRENGQCAIVRAGHCRNSKNELARVEFEKRIKKKRKSRRRGDGEWGFVVE